MSTGGRSEQVTDPPLVTSLAVGAIAGLTSGLFGVGGGIVIVPCLVLFARMDQRRAQALSLVAIVPIAVSGTIGYGLDGQVEWPVAALIALGGVVGAVIGTEVLHRAPIRALQIAFSVAALVTAVELFLNTPEPTGPDGLTVLLGVRATSRPGWPQGSRPASSASAGASSSCRCSRCCSGSRPCSPRAPRSRT